MYSIYDFIPIYDEKVQVTGWDHRRQKYPVDYPVCPNQLAHYKSFGSDQRFHVKESKVQEQLRTGADKPDFGIRGIPNPMVNMTTWGTIEWVPQINWVDCIENGMIRMILSSIPERYENMDEVTKIPKPLRKIDIMPKYTSTYKHHYRGTFFGTKIPVSFRLSLSQMLLFPKLRTFSSAPHEKWASHDQPKMQIRIHLWSEEWCHLQIHGWPYPLSSAGCQMHETTQKRKVIIFLWNN